MGITLHPGRLRWEMTRRGWTATALAREARISQGTVCTALAGRAISVTSLSLIAEALSRAPVMDVIDSLLSDSSSSTVE